MSLKFGSPTEDLEALAEIVAKLETQDYYNDAGWLINNPHFIKLKEIAVDWQNGVIVKAADEEADDTIFASMT